MKASPEEFSQLDQNTKINLISKASPQLLGILKKNISSFNSEELDNLHEISLLETASQAMAKNLSQQLFQIIADYAEPIEGELDKLKLTDAEKGVVDSIYKQTILVAIQRAADNVFQKLEKAEGPLSTQLISETVIDVMDSILSFKKKIDTAFPGLSDKIIATAVPVIVTAVSSYSPPVGLILKSTGVLDRAAEFLKTENLEKNIDKMRADLLEIKNDKQLAELQETGVKLAELAEQVETSPVSLGKLNVSLKGAIELMQEVANSAQSKKLLQDVCEYAEKHLPNSEKQIDKNFEAIKESTLKELRSFGASDDTLKEVSAILDNAIVQAKEEMQNALKPDNKIFDKITSVQQSADIIDKVANKITAVVAKNHPENQELNDISSKILKQETSKSIRGDTTKITQHLNNENPAKKFAKETLGAGLANEMTLKRLLPDKQVGRSV
ncbi:MAG: hypothetical protein NWS20_00980 [Rickettsiaceae bacterium]|nr:hypothetical protein [Rickettsiaceae bacterium]MDP4832696.1 hypothetical protein [Rickettsiaceae bacterium]MDP5020525.1 hypothetical protein [Rickettsiaceae bacterium]